jgi:hypothetical protein
LVAVEVIVVRQVLRDVSDGELRRRRLVSEQSLGNRVECLDQALLKRHGALLHDGRDRIRRRLLRSNRDRQGNEGE